MTIRVALLALILASPVTAQSLNFDSSRRYKPGFLDSLTPEQLSWLNPFNLPNSNNPTIPECTNGPDDPEPENELCHWTYGPDDGLAREWEISCRHGWCPWDVDLWRNTYGSDCGFWDPIECEQEPGWLEPDLSHAYATPEPATMILVGTGLAGLYAARRRRRGRV